MLNELEESMMITFHLIENINGKQKLLNEPKENSGVQKSSNPITKLLEVLSNRWDLREEQISNHEDRLAEIIEFESRKQKE